MKAGVWEELGARFGARLLLGEPLDRYTTYKIGGPAAALLVPLTSEEVAKCLRFCAREGLPWLVLGLGSNVLIQDDGFPGLVIRMGKGFDRVLGLEEDDQVWRVAAGMPTPRLARQTAKGGFTGMQKLVGIPGTVGGGVAMNAGANGQEYGQVIQSVEVVTPDGNLKEVLGHDVDWRYRGGLSGAVVTAAKIRVEAADADELLQDIREVLEFRKRSTPFDLPCCGSVFKNPEGTPLSAGRLIDAAGCKGFRVGAAEVSKLHANYIVNLGGATSAEVLAVMEAVQGRVFGEFGVELEPEVRIIQ